jgi:hypothetical protein
MYSLEEYLRKNAGRLDWISDAARQIVPVSGLDMATSLLQSCSGNAFPLALIEDVTGGVISYEAGFLDVSVHNLWVMDKPALPDLAVGRRDVMERCYGCCVDVLRLLLEDDAVADCSHGWHENRTRWDRSRTSYMPMPNVGLCYGWMFMISFYTDMGT